MKVVVVDYHMGNLFSILHACKECGIEALISESKEDIIKADAIILPGVGAFPTAMEKLQNQNLIEVLLEFANSGKPMLGICLGMQILMDQSDEFILTKGLGIIKGEVLRFPKEKNNTLLKIPQIAWNSTKILQKDTLLDGLSDDEYFYFVHSNYVLPYKSENAICNTTYSGHEYCSIIKNNNIYGIQFHPEKSGKAGLLLLKNFKKIIERSITNN